MMDTLRRRAVCDHEKEINALVRLGQLPSSFPAELQQHLNTCRRCSDQLRVSLLFQQARSQTARSASLQAPGLIWWRAQLRRRNAVVEVVGRPIFGAQIFALALNILIVLAAITYEASGSLEWLVSYWHSRPSQADVLSSLSSLIPAWKLGTLVPALAILAILAGVVLYLASSSTKEV